MSKLAAGKRNTIVERFPTRDERDARYEQLRKAEKRDLQRSTTQVLTGKLDKKDRPLGAIQWLLAYPRIPR